MIRFVCAQPATDYYAWQVDVMLNNFTEMGINLNWVDVVCQVINIVPEKWIKLAEHYPARFFFYNDTRETKHYISSIRPNILKQHFKKYPILEKQTILYHDCDIVLTKPMNLSQFTKDTIWYGSDTKWYISYDYIIGKGQDVFDEMCKIVDIDPQLVIDNNDNSIGAQYILKGINSEFWEDVEKDSERLYKEITQLNRKKKQENPSYHELQIWCADMWAVLWNGWKRGYQTRCHDDLQFSWATSTEDEYNQYNIMHNAGVTDSKSGLFYKAEYMNKLPYGLNLQIKEGTASKKYYEWIQRVETVSPIK